MPSPQRTTSPLLVDACEFFTSRAHCTAGHLHLHCNDRLTPSKVILMGHSAAVCSILGYTPRSLIDKFCAPWREHDALFTPPDSPPREWSTSDEESVARSRFPQNQHPMPLPSFPEYCRQTFEEYNRTQRRQNNRQSCMTQATSNFSTRPHSVHLEYPSAEAARTATAPTPTCAIFPNLLQSIRSSHINRNRNDLFAPRTGASAARRWRSHTGPKHHFSQPTHAVACTGHTLSNCDGGTNDTDSGTSGGDGIYGDGADGQRDTAAAPVCCQHCGKSFAFGGDMCAQIAAHSRECKHLNPPTIAPHTQSQEQSKQPRYEQISFCKDGSGRAMISTQDCSAPRSGGLCSFKIAAAVPADASYPAPVQCQHCGMQFACCDEMGDHITAHSLQCKGVVWDLISRYDPIAEVPDGNSAP